VKEPIRVGLSYRGRLDARFAVTIDGRRLSSLQIPIFNIAGLAQFDPAQLSLEASWRRAPWILALGATFKRWSDYPGPIEPTLPCPADEPECGSLVPAKIDYQNRVVLHAGGERKVRLGQTTTLALRLGARYEPSPLPDSLPGSEAFSAAKKGRIVVPTRYFDADRAIASAGFGVAFRGAFPCDVDGFAQYHHLVPRTIHSDGDTPSDGEVSGRVSVFGMLVGVSF
jgi:long-chain fatty acid transport protein